MEDRLCWRNQLRVVQFISRAFAGSSVGPAGPNGSSKPNGGRRLASLPRMNLCSRVLRRAWPAPVLAGSTLLYTTFSTPSFTAGCVSTAPAAPAPAADVYALTVPDLDGRPVPLEQYRAAFPVLLVVNVASK